MRNSPAGNSLSVDAPGPTVLRAACPFCRRSCNVVGARTDAPTLADHAPAWHPGGGLEGADSLCIGSGSSWAAA